MAEEGVTLEQLGFELDLDLYEMGDIFDLSDESLSFKDRYMALAKGITKGDIRKLKVKDLPKFMEAINEALKSQTNPTPESR
jgi:hypothetical protein